mgnify:CR=1 FL=1
MSTPYTIISNQSGIHDKLLKTVKKHLDFPYQHSPSDSQLALFDKCFALLKSHQSTPWILDSGCGTGMSTEILAKKHPDCIVLGLDKSAHRLAKHPKWDSGSTVCKIAGNAYLAQINLIDFWWLSHQNALRFQKHYILYPNPWPKAKQLKRRFHGHPIFHHLISLSYNLEVRSNWIIYLEEMLQSIRLLGVTSSIDVIAENELPVSLFEAKYMDQHEPIFRLMASSNPNT